MLWMDDIDNKELLYDLLDLCIANWLLIQEKIYN